MPSNSSGAIPGLLEADLSPKSLCAVALFPRGSAGIRRQKLRADARQTSLKSALSTSCLEGFDFSLRLLVRRFFLLVCFHRCDSARFRFHRRGVAHQTPLRLAMTMMTSSDSPALTGKRIAYSGVRPQLALDHVYRQASPHWLPALPGATAELVVLNLIAQQ